jgi:arginine N-succinyltransferase
MMQPLPMSSSSIHDMLPTNLLLRPVAEGDLDALQRLAAGAAPGIGSLRGDRAGLARRIQQSLQGFATEDEDTSGEETYLFVLQQAEVGSNGGAGSPGSDLLGCAGITTRAGYGSRFCSYRNEFVVASSSALGLTQRTHTLHLCHDLTGSTLLTSFYIVPGAPEVAAHLLSRARLLFLALHAQRFSERVVAEFPGLLHADGSSPFWDAVGRRFFGMAYPQAEALAGGRSKTFIVDLMPQAPLYVPLLPEAAQRAIGQLHPDGQLPFQILLDEGIDADTYIDIFDGGPTAEGRLQALRSVRAAQPLGAFANTPQALLACTRRRQDFRARLVLPGDAAGGLRAELSAELGADALATPLVLPDTV